MEGGGGRPTAAYFKTPAVNAVFAAATTSPIRGPLSHKERKEEERPAAGMQFSAFFGGKKQTPPPAAVARPESKNSGVLRSICFARERKKLFFSVSAQQIQGHVLKTCVPAFSFPPFVAGTVANSPFSPAEEK